LKDTRTPLRFALLRVTLTITLGFIAGLKIPLWLGLDPSLGTTGLTASAGVSGWLEFLLLRRALNRRIGKTGLPIPFLVKIWSAAILSACLGYGIKRFMPHFHPIIRAGLILGPYGILYFAFTSVIGIEESRKVVRKIHHKIRHKS
jgi:putative peptidoglycan lipid II flippase